jgi:hypothetical protein
MRSNDKLCFRATRDVFSKDPIGIIKIRDYDGKAFEEHRKLGIDRTISSEEAGQGSRFDRSNFIHQSARQSNLRDMRIPQNFQMRLGELLPQGGKNRKLKMKSPGAPPRMTRILPREFVTRIQTRKRITRSSFPAFDFIKTPLAQGGQERDKKEGALH